ncbi:MAG: hypothetical protein OXF41_14180 [bacterium]|nr:hypothetical protein [bacterium]
MIVETVVAPVESVDSTVEGTVEARLVADGMDGDPDGAGSRAL